MSELYVAGHDIERYLPSRIPDRHKELIATTARTVVDRIENRRPIALRYNSIARMIHPYTEHLQSSTVRKGVQIPDPQKIKGDPWDHRAYKLGARRIVGLDGYQVRAEGGLHNGWRSFHLDRIDDLELLDEEEMIEIFLSDDPSREELAAWDRYMNHEFRVVSDTFARNHRHENRIYLAQVNTGREKLPRLRK